MQTEDAMERTSERGQLLVVFALALVAIVGIVGLVIDGGSMFVQKRDQQNVVDLAAMAAGYADLAEQDPAAAARTIAAANGYTNGVAGTTVDVTIADDGVTVSITRPHRNYFAGVLGFASWDVSAGATSRSGIPNGAFGAMPLIFNEDAFYDDANRDPGAPASFGEPGNGTEDVPLGPDHFNWTVFCTANGNPCNGNTDTVEQIILGNGTSTTVYLNDLIGPLNAGAHTALFDVLAGRVGDAYPVGIVDDDGAMVGWAWFHIIGSVGGSTKQILGWFDDEINAPPMLISPTGGDAQTSYGTWVVQLVD